MHNVSGGTAVTAPNTAQNFAYGLVFLGGKLTAASAVSKGSMALGRNWGAYGAAAFLKTQLGAHIKPVGWVPMGENTLDTARFSEYQTTGDGAPSIFYEDRDLMAVRMKRIHHPRAWSQKTEWGTSHVVSNVIIERQDAAAVDALLSAATSAAA